MKVTKIQKLVVEKDEMLVVNIPGCSDEQEAREFRQMLAQKFGLPEDRILVCFGDITFITVKVKGKRNEKSKKSKVFD